MKALAILIACGKEEEIAPGAEAAYLSLGACPVLAHSLKTFEESSVIDGVIVAVEKARVSATLHAVKRYGCTKVRGVVVGGVSRMSTLRAVFAKMPESASVIVVHEASRPFVTLSVLEETVKAAKRYGCSIAAHKIPDATKVAPKGVKASITLDRNSVWVAQTPQVFKMDVFEKIIDSKNKGIKLVDDESEFVGTSAEVHMVEAGYENMKIRNSSVLAVATALLHAKLV